MKVTFKKPFNEEDDVMFRAAQLDSDLRRLGYDEQHRILIINALYEKADRDGAAVEDDEFEHIYQ